MDDTTMQREQMREAPQSVVGSCDVTNCTYNDQRHCTASTIQVAFVDNMAHCATYTPQAGAIGMGSTEAPQRTSADIGKRQ
jgi:hypothetical protein